MDKKPLLWLSSVVLVILSIFLLVEINHVWNTATTTNTISFSGEGKASATPDIAMISASVVTQDANAKTAQDDNATKANKVTDFLKNQGIDPNDIKTSNYNIYPQYRYPQDSQPIITGYQVSQDFQVKVRDLTKVSAILSGLVSSGANQVNNLGLQIDNPDKVLADARQKAIEAAKQKAQDVSGQVGISLGKIVNFSESLGGTPTPVMYASGIGGGGGGPEPAISPGQNEVTVNVTLTYQIK